jgi:NADH-quinone oxidoreductase subunit C
MYGVMFEGNPDLRRILTDYGFRGHPAAQGFPADRLCRAALFDEQLKRVSTSRSSWPGIPQFDFMSPWEGARIRAAGAMRREAPKP